MARPRWSKLAMAAGGIAAAYALERVTVGRARRSVDADVVGRFHLPDGTTFHYLDTSDGGVVRVAERGEGPPLVLLHGVTHAAEVWSWQFEDLAPAHRVIALDHRGHGQSTAGRDPWSIARLAADAAEVIEHLDLRGAIVVGHSLGGIVAQQLLLDRPDLVATSSSPSSPVLTVRTDSPPVRSDCQSDGGVAARVRGAVLMATTPGGLNLLPATWEGVSRAALGTARRGLTAAGRLQHRLLAPTDLAWLMFRFGLGADADPTHVELTRRLTAATPFSTLSELMEDVVGFDLRDRLGEITVPTLVIGGTRDLVTPIRDARLMAQRIAGARLEVLPGAGHMVMLERRAEVSDLLASFARDVGGDGAAP